MRISMMKRINCILALVLCLSLLAACGSDVGAIVPTRGTQSSAGHATGGVISGQNKPEAETEDSVFHPITYQVDISHDEIPEELVVSQAKEGGAIRMELSLTQEGRTLWTANLDLAEGMTKKAYFLCKIGEEDFLASYRSYLAEGSYRYTFEVFDLEGKRLHHVDNDSFLFGLNAIGGYPIDSAGLGRFSDWMNRYLDQGFLLAANTGGAYTYSTLDVQKTEQENFAEAFLPAESYQDCETLTDKADRYNVLHDDHEGNEPVTLTKPEGFDQTASEMLAENIKHLKLGELFSVEKGLWFTDYNGWAIQVVRTDDDYESPLDSENTVFYYPSDELSVEEIAAKMLEFLIAESAVETEERTFVLNNYQILEQQLMDSEDSWELCLKDWHEVAPNVQANLRAYVRDWLLYRADAAGFIPLGEEMWYFVPRGYFSFSGECEGKTMAEIMNEFPEQVVGGKVPLLDEANADNVVFVLMKQGNVYRLQSIGGMIATHEAKQKK